MADETPPTCLGWTVEEERENGTTILTVHHRDHTDAIHVPLPLLIDDGDLASSIWPTSLAAAILCRHGVLQSAISGKNILELGSGLGVFGLTAAHSAASVHLTDRNERVVQALQALFTTTSDDHRHASVLEWRDEHAPPNRRSDIILGSDIAYYYFLLRPLMDTIVQYRQPTDSLLCIVGQANRESLWDLYTNISKGCYNQLTDEHDPPWKGDSEMLLYRLEMETWAEDDEEPTIDGDVPIAVLLHASPGFVMGQRCDWDHVATDQDFKAMDMSF